MASADPRDPMYGQPYTGTPVLQSASRAEEGQSVLDMYRMTVRSIDTLDDDDHYTPDGSLYHE